MVRLLRDGASAALLAVVAAAAAAGAAMAAPGDADMTFGSGGKVLTSLGGDTRANAVVAQPDGRLVAAGGAGGAFTVVRYLPDGSLDPSFGRGGIAAAAPDPEGEFVALAEQPDGKLVAAGSIGGRRPAEFALVRYLPDGSLDPGFGNGGMVLTPISNNGARAYDLALLGDGRMVVAGLTANCTSDCQQARLALARYLPDGNLDATFGSGGIATYAPGSFDPGAAVIAVEPDGAYVVGLPASPAEAGVSSRIARYLPDGSPDPTFGTGGLVTPALPGGTALVRDLAALPDGRIVAGLDAVGGVGLARYRLDGSPDPSFAGGGQEVVPLRSPIGVSSLLIDDAGRIVVASSGIGACPALARFTPDGQADGSFGAQGVVDQLGPLGPDETGPGAICTDPQVALAEDSDGKLVVTSGAYGSPNPLLIARYEGGSGPPRPVLTVSAPASTPLDTALRNGLTVRAACLRDCVLSFDLTLSRAARSVNARSVAARRIAHAHASLSFAGNAQRQLRFSRAGRRLLSRARGGILRLRVTSKYWHGPGGSSRGAPVTIHRTIVLRQRRGRSG